MSTTVNVPTCNYTEYKLLSPYDSDLQTAFNSSLNSDFKNRDDSNNCLMCQQNMSQLGYSSDLYNCSSCLDLRAGTGYSGKYPILTQTWGCDTCATTVAPVSLYESGSDTLTVASADKLQLYLTDLTYKGKVDSNWSSSSPCVKGETVKSICINPSIPSFSMNVPPVSQGPSNPTSSGGLSTGAIVGIVIGSIIGFIFLLFIVYAILFWKKYVSNKIRNYI